ncbi:Conserved_hypothetical protein [Hexamita inflata]|uniref:Uncharacterized protein n=1 Tax=Hexamita inflata TaxID=28002 RepID=A0AA86TXR6_9EUKA|nr:Conserved hypothetical protein [Hexamita inflata]
MLMLLNIRNELVNVLSNQLELQNCYNLRTQALLFSTNQSICLNLVSSNITDCNSFPKSVKFSIQLDAFNLLSTPYTPQIIVTDFNYSTTEQICVQCLDPVCKSLNFQLSTKVKFRIETTSRFTECVCGKIERFEENRNECFHEDRINDQDFESKIILEQTQVCYWAAVNDKCSQMNSMMQTRVTVSIQYNDSVQTYVYEPNDAQSSFELVQKTGTPGFFKYCFQDPKGLRFISKRIPIVGQLVIESTLNGIQLQTTSQTKRVNIQETSDGYYHTTAAIQVVEIQLYGLISIEQANIMNSKQKDIKNLKSYSYITIHSKISEHTITGYSTDFINYMNNSITYISKDFNPLLYQQIAKINNSEDITSLQAYWNNFISDENGNVIFANRKRIDEIIVSCWTNISATWNTPTQLTVHVTNDANQKHCQLVKLQNISVSLSQILNLSEPHILTPSFTMKIVNYSVNQTFFVLSTTNISLKQQVDSAFYNQFIIYDSQGSQLENAEIDYWTHLKQDQVTFQIKTLLICMLTTGIYAISYKYVKAKILSKKQLHLAEDRVLPDGKV